jgi:hypothetical protein
VIRNFSRTDTSNNGYGIQFAPSASPSATIPDQLFVDNTTIEGNGFSGTTNPGQLGGGIFVQPTGSPLVAVSVSNSQSSNNGFGMRVDTSLMSGGAVYSSVADSEMNGNGSAGIAALTAAAGGVTNVINIQRTTVAHNPTGLNANGNAAVIHIGSSILFDSSTQGVKTSNSGVIDSTGGNSFFNNPTGSGPSLTIVGPF